MARILIAEDDASSRQVMTQVLGRAGHETRGAKNASEAIQSAGEFKPDVLIVDWLLPDASGVDVANQVRADCPSAAVVFISGFSVEELKGDSCHLHPAAILRKPFSSEHIIEAVEEALAGRAHART